MLTENPRVVFAKRPGNSIPIPGEHVIFESSHSTIDLDGVPLNGGYLTKTLMLSPEPFMRERMRELSVPSYSTHAVLGAPLVGFGLVVVLRSEKEGIKPGDRLYGLTPWEAYTVQPYIEGRANYNPAEAPDYTFDVDALSLQIVPDPKGAFPWTRYFSVLGAPGLTAFCGFEGCADAKPGETIWVSSGASAVGMVVVQLAKAKGLKVIASAGADSKVEYMRSLGADVSFNYKTTPIAEVLKEHGPLDIYWDNVGGKSLEVAIEYSRLHARLIMCGAISEYALPYEQRHGIKNTNMIFKKRLRIEGFLVPDLAPRLAPRFYAEMPLLLAQGKITAKEYISEGLSSGPEALAAVLREGGNEAVGKPIIRVALD
ncbi:zinc-type alcohol dehydrogenase-like protein PB24D3.08c [Favolaschia claudopus]|uniref:Zinc-type alcohol dehydrogenase-like protein PB24D3.08c n=1 Tax=Favolaschia claudopus TaxID=2862362 RepID=A0AAW0CHL2_9AGAR